MHQLIGSLSPTYADLNQSRLDNKGVRGAALAPARVALVHDWISGQEANEVVLEEVLASLPALDLYSLFSFPPGARRSFLNGKHIQTSVLQRLPFARYRHAAYLPLAPLAIEQFDLREYDIVVSSGQLVAPGVITTADQLHICYLHGLDRPIQFQNVSGSPTSIEMRPGGILKRLTQHYMRFYDTLVESRVDVFIAGSSAVANRIWKAYRRRATIIHPPVDTDAYRLWEDKDDYYVLVAPLVPAKRVNLIVEAFRALPDRELLVIGDGPEFKHIEKIASPNITLLGPQPFEVVRYYLQHARAFVLAAEEEFCLKAMEAQACGTPVIAYGRGEITDCILPGRTGVFFSQLSADAIEEAIRVFEDMRDEFAPRVIRANAERFSKVCFREQFSSFIQSEYRRFLESEGGY